MTPRKSQEREIIGQFITALSVKRRWFAVADRHADEVGHDLDWKAVRRQIGLTPNELASTLGTSTSTVYRWDSGQTAPSLAYQRQILDLLDEAVAG